jgi:hypothetical protein
LFGINHDVYATSRSLIDDLGSLLRTGMHPPSGRTSEIRGVPEGVVKPDYWRFVP